MVAVYLRVWTCVMAVGLLTAATSPAEGARVNFSGVDLESVSDVNGQNFSYTVGTGPETGTVNVRLLSGTINQLTTGQGPDPTGLYVIEHYLHLTPPATFRFTFGGASRAFRIDENETLTAAETNAFTLPSGAWTLVSMADATKSESGSTISFTGTNYVSPFGYYSISGTGFSFDFTITNISYFIGLYGSGISIDVLPEPATLSLLALGGVALLRQKRR